METGFSEYIKNVKESFKDGSTGEMLGSEIYYDALRNMWHNSEFVPFVNEASLVQRRRFKNNKVKYFKNVQVASDTIVDDENTIKIGNNILGDPVYKPFIKTTISGGTYLYRYVGFRRVGEKEYGVYVIDRAMGKEPKAGKVIVEHGLSDSIFEENNTIKVEEKELLELNTIYGEIDGKVVYNYEGFVYMPSELSVLSNEYVPAEDEPVAAEIEETVETSTIPSEFTLNSGGAYGSDFEWGNVATEFGIVNINHLYHGNKTPYGNKSLTDAQLEEGWKHVLEANKTLKRRPEGYKSLLGRNWFQVKDSDAVYAIADIDFNTNIVKGGTGWAVQMAIDSNKLTFVYDMNSHSWWRYDKSVRKFLKYEGSPTLTKNFAGIGTRGVKQTDGTYKLQDEAKQAIRGVFEATFGSKISNIQDRIVEGDITKIQGIKVIPTNLGGVHGAGLAKTAATKGWIKRGKGKFEVTVTSDLEGVITFPVKKVWSDKTDINLLKDSLEKLGDVASMGVQEGSDSKILLPLVGIGHGEGDIDVIVPMLRRFLEEHSNVTLVLPSQQAFDAAKKGTARTDRTMENMSRIKELLGTEAKSTGAPITKETSFKEITTDDIQENNELYKHCK